MPFARNTDGQRLYFESIGQGEPLLLLAGQSCDHREWERVAVDFASDFQVIVWDYLGTGQSDKPDSPAYSTRGFAADAACVLDACAIAKAHVYGFSMGGRVAQWLAIDHSDRLGVLVLGATTPGNKHGVGRPAHMNKALLSKDTQILLEGSFTPDWISRNRPLADTIASHWNQALPPHVRKLHYQASEAHDAWDHLSSIGAPTIVVHGSDDQVNPAANAKLLAEQIPGAQLCILPGARHGFFEELRHIAHREVRDFILRHPMKG